MSIDPAQLDKLGLPNTTDFDPAAPDTTRELISKLTGLKLVGDDTLNGVPVKHIQGMLDVAALPGVEPQTAQQLAGKQLTMDIYLDAGLRFTRIQGGLQYTAANGAPFTLTLTEDITSRDAPVTVDEPTPDMVTDITGSIGGAGGATTTVAA
jgi:hypothetical protein